MLSHCRRGLPKYTDQCMAIRGCNARYSAESDVRWGSWPFRRVKLMAAVEGKRAVASSRSVAICGWAGLAGLPRGNVPSWGRERAGDSNSPGDWRTPVQRGVRASAVPAARSSDRHLTVGLGVTGRHPASRTGPERNMPAPLTLGSPGHGPGRAAGHFRCRGRPRQQPARRM
jgi:hypothetical protein